MDHISPDPGPSRSWLVAVTLPIVGLAAPVVTLVLAWWAFSLVFTLAGGTPPTPEESERATGLALAAGLAAVGLPVIGLVLAIRTGERFVIGLFSTMAVIGLVVGIVLAVVFVLPVALDREGSPRPTSSSTWSGCQERSGGGTDCPGG